MSVVQTQKYFKEFSLHHTHPRPEIEDGGVTETLGRAKNPDDIFINLDSATETDVRSKKVEAVALVKWLTKKDVEKIQEDHQQAVISRDDQIQALEFMNEEERQAHQQQILRLNEEHQQSLEEKEHEINDLIANRHVAHRGCFDNVLCFIKKNSGEGHPYYVIRCQYRLLEKYKRRLRVRYPNMEVTDECDGPNAIHRWCRFKREVIKKPNYYKNHFSLTEEKRALLETALDLSV